jgi:polysaccharide biosynthesis protein PslH
MAKRVLHIMNRVPWPVKDGGTLACYNLMKGLHDAGCEVTLAAMNTSKHYIDTDTLPQSFNRIAEVHTSFVNNNVKPSGAFLNLFTQRSYNIDRFITPGFKALLAEILERNTFDLVIFDNLFTAAYVDLVRSKSSAKLVLRQHNVEYRIWETLAQQATNPLKKWYLHLLAGRLQRFERQYINKFDALITLTQSDKDDMLRMGCKIPVHVLPSGIEFKNTVINTKPLPGSVFHLGAMDWMPNIQAMEWFVREVWPKVHAVHPEAVFYMAGKKMPAEFSRYQSDSIKIVGEVDDAIAFMQSRQIMVVPLLAGSGIRIKILEGMSLGKAIVSTTLGATGLEAEDGKHLLIADDAGHFAQCINRLLSDAQLCAAIGQEARQQATDVYHNNKVISRLLAIL